MTVILTDGNIGQMMEPAELPEMKPIKKDIPDWAVAGIKGRPRRVLTSINLEPRLQEETNMRLIKRWQEVSANEVRYKKYFTGGCRVARDRFRFGRAGGALGRARRHARRASRSA